MSRSTKLPLAAPKDRRLRGLLDRLQDESVVAAVLFGSVARGDDDKQSDLDVLVVVKDKSARETVLSRFRSRTNETYCPLVLTVASLHREALDHPSFVAHLLDEGRILQQQPAWDDLTRSLSTSVFDSEALGREVLNRAKALEPLLRTERFRNSPVTALSHLYGIARSLVVARLLQEGIHEYSWQRAFDRYADIHPELRSTLQALKELRPYYEYARARSPSVLPPRSIGTREISELVGSVAQLAK